MKERVKKINRLIKEELGKIILKEIEFSKDVFVTLTRVETSKNLDHCNVFVSCFPEKELENILTILNQSIYHLQKLLDRKIIIKKVPKILFLAEKKVTEAEKIEKILEKLKKKEN